MDDAVVVVQALTAETLALFGGVQIVLTGLMALLGKLWLERERSKLSTDLETVKATLERALHVHGVQFEHEYQVYTELWDKLIPLPGQFCLRHAPRMPQLPEATGESLYDLGLLNPRFPLRHAAPLRIASF